MKSRLYLLAIGLFMSLLSGFQVFAQQKVWTIDECIQYALEKNIQVQKAEVSNSVSEINLRYAKSAWHPSLGGSVRQNFDWSNQSGNIGGAAVYKGTNGTNISVSSGMTLFNGNRLHNQVRRSETELEADRYNTEVIKENVSLSVLNAYLQVLYSEEQVKNSANQISSTEEELKLAEERMRLGVISNSDYLQVKSQLASEKQTLASAQSLLAVNRITLMQLMELPETDNFSIEHPDLDSLVNLNIHPDPAEVYQIALNTKPEVRNAELNRKSSEIGVDLAKAAFYPDITASAGVSTMYASAGNVVSYGSQLKDNISPAAGFTASIPIYTNRQAKTNLEIARKNTDNAELDELNVKNQLRKEIEQACQDVVSSQIEFEASLEAYKAARESFDVASEKYFQGLMNSVDFLFQKTAFISAESSFLQSRYRLIFSYKVLDFYSGKPLSFKYDNY